MIKDKTLKRLAESYFYLGKILTESEKNALKNSEYKNLLETTTSVVSEDASSVDEKKVPTTKKPTRHSLHPGINKYGEISDLIDDLEMEFNLDLTNSSPFKYNSVDLVKFKDYIRKYITQYFTVKSNLLYVTKLINSPRKTVVDILYGLYISAD